MDYSFVELPLGDAACCGAVVIESLGWAADRRLLVTSRCRVCGKRFERVALLDSLTYEPRQPTESFSSFKPWFCNSTCGRVCHIVRIEVGPDFLFRLRLQCEVCGRTMSRVYDLEQGGYILRGSHDLQRPQRATRMRNWGSFRGQAPIQEPGSLDVIGHTDPYDWSS
jgi:hypothetical protein